MNYEDLSLSDILRLMKAIERSNTNPDVVRAVIESVPAEPMENGRVTVGSMLKLLKQTNGCTVLPEEIVAQLNTPEPIPVQPILIQQPINNPYLHLLSNQPLVIGPTDGSKIIADAADVFTAGIDVDFRKWGTNKPGIATKETLISVYELAQDSAFAQMFSSLSSDLDKLCLTQAQIIKLVTTHRNQLRTGGYGNFFLFKSNGDLFVASVYVYDDGSLYAYVRRFGNANVCHAAHHHRLFAPQLA